MKRQTTAAPTREMAIGRKIIDFARRLAAAEAIGQGGEDQPDRDPDERDQHDPAQRVADRPQHALVGEEEAVVLEADELLGPGVPEAEDDGVDHRIHEEDGHDDQRRPHEHVGPDPLASSLGQEVDDAVHPPEQEEDATDAHGDGDGHDQEAVGLFVPQERERGPEPGQHGERHEHRERHPAEGSADRRRGAGRRGHGAAGSGRDATAPSRRVDGRLPVSLIATRTASSPRWPRAEARARRGRPAGTRPCRSRSCPAPTADGIMSEASNRPDSSANAVVRTSEASARTKST